MKRHRPHAFIRMIHRQVDATSEKLKARAEQAGAPVACRGAGCAWCCWEPVYAVRAEAKLIADRVRAMEEEPRERVLRELRRCVDRLQASPLWSQEQPPVVPYRRLDLRCPLLGPDLRCTVYEDRPCGCRMHLARKPAEPFCSDDEHRPHQQFIMAGLYSQGPLVSLAVNGQAEYDHLIVLLAGELLGATLESGAARKFIVTRKHVSFPSPSTR